MISNTKSKNITGSNIRRVRIAQELSQQDVERISSLQGKSMTRSKLAKIESGMIRVTDEILRDLASVLNVDINEFFEEK
ncbi:helix-turn-helix transcriptional regulator [Vibrio hannami]|uniref:helix-turn-helix domain-containing protein n=1 Tax=Vibrio hannami TaxID=2717094 RepID=UPI00240F3FE4|nr:helix-turn-helix transcriptional regulator [Vibrio hannami]MDG3085278.1 helix-turn-helix transcriptional regulator [Vibrio hannami]